MFKEKENIFAKTYYTMITESNAKAKEPAKSEAMDDYDSIMNAVLDEMKWKEEKRKAVADLLYMYKNEKYKMEAIALKMRELLSNDKFFNEYSAIMADFQKLNLDMNRYMSLQEGFNKMLDNPNYDNRRNFMRRVARWLDKEDAQTVVALNEVEGRLRKLVKKYTIGE